MDVKLRIYNCAYQNPRSPERDIQAVGTRAGFGQFQWVGLNFIS